jgi:uncharacterized protein involved in exopolysaccharide biosynthesis
MTPQQKIEDQLAEHDPVSLERDFAPGKRQFLDPLIILARRKSFIMGFTVTAALIAIAVAWLLPQYYTATAKLLPPQQNQSISAAMMTQLGQLGPLLGLAAGKDLGIHNPSDMYVAMLKSRTVADNLINRFSLLTAYNKKFRIDARNRLDDLSEVSAGKDGIISISVDDRSPARAAELANAYVEELEKLTRVLAVTDAGKRRIFFEQEVKAANDELAKAELSLKETEEKTGIIQLDNQSRVMLQAYAELRAQVVAKQVQVQSISSFATPENPDLIRAQEELRALEAQLTRFERGQGGHSPTDLALEKVPGASLEYIRKLREVKYEEALFELLAKQYEAARLDEARDASIIQVLDKAVVPEKRSWPKRSLIVLAVTLFALFVAVFLAFARDQLERVRKDPESAVKWQLLVHLLAIRKPLRRSMP